jgi:hypothetical protein
VRGPALAGAVAAAATTETAASKKTVQQLQQQLQCLLQQLQPYNINSNS